nr:PREDICTED: SLAM family member 6-like [Lepisosteus oculatus]
MNAHFLTLALFPLAFLLPGVRTEENNHAKNVSAMQGGSLHLTVNVPVHLEMETLEWNLVREKEEVIILRKLNGSSNVKWFRHKNQVVFDETDFSLRLTNLSHGNAGTYTALLSDTSGKKHKLSIYHVSVLEVLSIPELVVVDRSFENDTCHFHINCSTHQYTYATFDCQLGSDLPSCNWTIKQKSGSHGTEMILSVSQNHSAVVCNISNQASSQSTSALVKNICQPSAKGDTGNKMIFTLIIILIAAICATVCLLALLCAFVKIHLKAKKTDEKYFIAPNMGNSGEQQNHQYQQESAQDEHEQDICTVYDTVKPERMSTESIPQASTAHPVKTETLYSMVRRPPKCNDIV